jgi:hypothetical protein
MHRLVSLMDIIGLSGDILRPETHEFFF